MWVDLLENIIIRDIELNDKEKYLEMTKSLFDSYATISGYDRNIAISNFKNALSKSELFRCVIIEQEKNILGYMFFAFGYSTSLGGRCIFLEDLYIMPFARKKGKASLAIKWLIEKYKYDIVEIKLEVTKENFNALKFYSKFEFLENKYISMYKVL